MPGYRNTIDNIKWADSDPFRTHRRVEKIPEEGGKVYSFLPLKARSINTIHYFAPFGANEFYPRKQTARSRQNQTRSLFTKMCLAGHVQMRLPKVMLPSSQDLGTRGQSLLGLGMEVTSQHSTLRQRSILCVLPVRWMKKSMTWHYNLRYSFRCSTRWLFIFGLHSYGLYDRRGSFDTVDVPDWDIERSINFRSSEFIPGMSPLVLNFAGCAGTSKGFRILFLDAGKWIGVFFGLQLWPKRIRSGRYRLC